MSGISMGVSDSHAARSEHEANRSPAIDRDAVWSEEEFAATEALLSERKPASEGVGDLVAFFPGPGIDRAIRAVLSTPEKPVPEFLAKRLKTHSDLAFEKIDATLANPDASTTLKAELSALKAWISARI